MEAEEQWTDAQRSAANLGPAACTDQDGSVWVRLPAMEREGRRPASCGTSSCRERQMPPDKDAARAAGSTLRRRQGNCWHPSMAAGPATSVAAAYDAYQGGDYDVGGYPRCPEAGRRAAPWPARPASRPAPPPATTPRAVCGSPTRKARNSGARTSAPSPDDGNPLYNARSVRVVCLEDGKLMEPVAELPHLADDAAAGPGQAGRPITRRPPRYSNPQLGLDGKGRLWLTYRQKFGTRYSTHPRLVLADLRPPARRRPLDRPDRGRITPTACSTRRPCVLPHPSGGVAHRPQHRRPLHDAGQDPTTWFTSAISICPAIRSSRSWCRTTPARRTTSWRPRRRPSGRP